MAIDESGAKKLDKLTEKLTDMLSSKKSCMGFGGIFKGVQKNEKKALRKMIIDSASENEVTVKYIMKWVDEYIRNIRCKSSSVRSYLDRIERDKYRLETFMGSDRSLNRSFTACKLLSERLNQLFDKLYNTLLGSSESGVLADGEDKEFKKLEVPIDFSRILEKIEDMLSSKDRFVDIRMIFKWWKRKEKKALWKMIAHASEKEGNVEYIKTWVDNYICSIQRGSSSIRSYLDRIERDPQRLEVFMDNDPLLNRFSACKILSERLNQICQMFFMDLSSESVEVKGLRDANKLDGDMRSTKNVGNRVIGGLIVTNKKIDVGRAGCVFFEGFYYDNPVAVKPLAKTHHSWVVKQIQLIIKSNRHPNFVGCLGEEYDLDFNYIILERWTYSLHDFILKNHDGENELDELWRDGFPSTLPIDLMRDIASGVAHLHDRGIVHGDLKPENVFVIKQTSTKVTAKISDMSICNEPNENMSSLTNATGWQPREVVPHEHLTEDVDLLSLGCIFFFCITRGKHPFGEGFDKKDLFLIDDFPEVVDLISRLLNPDPKLRPKAKEVIHHPLFWNFHMRISFFRDASDRVEFEYQNSQLLNTLEGVDLGGKSWKKKIHQVVLNDLRHHRQYKFNRVRDLLRLIRNSLNHYNDFSVESWAKLGSSLRGVEAYLSTRFPKLFIGVYNVILNHCAAEDGFHVYFEL